MSLKKRLILILTAAGVVLALLFHFSINATIFPDLKEQKNDVIDKLKVTLAASLAAEQKSVAAICTGWAQMEKTVSYINNPSGEMERELFSDIFFFNHMLNMVLVVYPGEKTLYNRNYREDVKFIAFDRLKIGGAVKQVIKRLNKTQTAFTGIINSAYGPLIFSASPIKAGGKLPGPAAGILMVGRFMDQKLLSKISCHFTETLELVSFKEKPLFVSYLKQMQGKTFAYREDDEKLSTLYLVKDIDNMPSFILKAETGNRIFRLVKRHTILYVISIVLSIVLLGFLVYFTIERYITRRITKISADMRNVRELRDISRRVTQDTLGDEISSLVANINNMLEKIEKRLITSEKLVSIGRLSASIAHEINNPMLAIANCLQALKKACKKCTEDESQVHRQAISVSEIEIDRVRNIIANLLDYHRLDREEFSPVSLDEVIQQSLEILKWSKKLDSIKIITKKQQNFSIFGSHGKLKQVFINFILNSAEANCDNNGVLHIEILPSADNNFCEVHFIDNGPGIPEEIKNKLFEPFISTKQEKGAGLGLYVSYKIIENHNGEILYDDSYKKGAYFIIRLPLKR